MCFAMPKQHHMCWVPPHIRFLVSLRALQPKPSCGGGSRHSHPSQRGALVSKSDTFLDKMCRWFINSFTCGVPTERRAGRATWKHCAHHISAGPPQCVPCQGAGHAHRQATQGEKVSSRKANVLRLCFAMPKQHHICWVSLHIRFLMSLRALQPKFSCEGWSRHSDHSQRGAVLSKSDTFLDKMCR